MLRVAGEELQGVGHGGRDRFPSLPDRTRRSRKRHNQCGAAGPHHLAGQHCVRGTADEGYPHRLGHAWNLPRDDGPHRLRRHVARTETGSARGYDKARLPDPCP